MISTDPKVLFVTWVHNGENTISMTVESVLSQTYSHFVYIIVDNASTDNTAKIIQSYANRDSRIKYLRREVNSCDLVLYEWVLKSINESYDYFANIDGDDEYVPDFLEKMIHFAQAHDLDIACGGFDIIHSITKENIETRSINEHMLLTDNASLENNFPDYYANYARQIWGKLYKASIISCLNFESTPHRDVSHGADTIFCLAAYQLASRVGILAAPIYRYYVNPGALSKRLSHKRLESSSILYDAMYTFLIEKFGAVSEKNDYILRIIYLQNTMDTVRVLISSTIDLSTKLDYLCKLFSDEQLKLIFKQVNMTDKNNLLMTITEWIHSQRNSVDCGNTAQLEMLSVKVAVIDTAISTPPSLAHVCKDACDDVFYTLLSMLMTRPIEHLILAAVQNVRAWKTIDSSRYDALIEQHKVYGVNDFALEPGFITYFGKLYTNLKTNVEQLYSAYGNLTDYQAKLDFTDRLSQQILFKPVSMLI